MVMVSKSGETILLATTVYLMANIDAVEILVVNQLWNFNLKIFDICKTKITILNVNQNSYEGLI